MAFEYLSKFITAAEAAATVKDNDFVILANGVCGPLEFINALSARATELHGVKMNHAKITSAQPLPYVDPAMAPHLMYDTFAFAIEFKKTMMAGGADFAHCGYRDVACFISDGTFNPDVTVFQITPPDAGGYCSLGLTGSYLPAAIKRSKLVIAEVNAQLPVTGGYRVHVDDIDYFIDVDYPLPSTPPIPFGDVERRIGEYIGTFIVKEGRAAVIFREIHRKSEPFQNAVGPFFCIGVAREFIFRNALQGNAASLKMQCGNESGKRIVKSAVFAEHPTVCLAAFGLKRAESGDPMLRACRTL